MNRPRKALMDALIEDLRPLVVQLRELGWPTDIRVVADQTTKQLIEVQLVVGMEWKPTEPNSHPVGPTDWAAE